MEPLFEFLHSPLLGKATWLWLVFMGVVVTLLVLDLGVLHKDDREIGVGGGGQDRTGPGWISPNGTRRRV